MAHREPERGRSGGTAWLVALVLLAGTSAQAGEPVGPDDLAAQPRSADPVPVPQEYLQDQPDVARASSNVLFVNFDGAQMQYGEDNSAQNITQIQQCAINFQPYGNGQKRQATLQAVQNDWSPFNVIITETRPQAGDYAMCVTSPNNPFGGGVLGIAPLDCNDQQKRNVVYAFHSDSDQFSSATQATTISQELAHAFGLEHVNEPNDIMNPYNAGADPAFLDQCISIDPGNLGYVCAQQHIPTCGGQGTSQNSYAELMALFGPNAPDTQPPTVSIVTPQDGQMFNAGTDFPIEVNATDDIEVIEVKLFNFQSSVATWNSPPYQTLAQQPPAGSYQFRAEARDAAGNVGMSNIVNVTVIEQSGSSSDSGDTGVTSGSSSGTGTDTGATSDSDSASGTGEVDSGADSGADGGSEEEDDDGGNNDNDTSDDNPALPPGYGGQDADDDSGCAIAGGSLPAGALLGLWVLVVGPRRRKAA